MAVDLQVIETALMMFSSSLPFDMRWLVRDFREYLGKDRLLDTALLLGDIYPPNSGYLILSL
eukprot:5451688-Ditylum_brightwellii.AAC.1